jgi:alpha-1,3-rhamnosyltransferase
MMTPLVSIVVTTYNSANFVVETLESAKSQTWSNLELIISDDCSADNTLEVCREWLIKNSGRFVRTEIISVPKNTGVSANCNRCIAAARANWIKMIAGDDILFPNCVQDNMDFVSGTPAAAIIFSQVKVYQNEFKDENLLETDPDKYPKNLMDVAFSASDQYKLLLLSDRINYTPSYFFNKHTILSVGGYDEGNRLVEDYPMWLKLTNAGNRLFYFHTPTVGYRRHQMAANNRAEFGLFKPLVLKMGDLKNKYVFPNLPWDIAYSEMYILMVSRIFQQLGMNKKNTACSFLYKLSTHYLNPFQYFIFFKRRVMGLGKTDTFYKDFSGS